MTVYALPFLHFFNLLLCLYLAIYVILKNHKATINRVLTLILLCFCIWSFGKIFTNNPYTEKETVKLLLKTGCIGWCSFSSFFLWFSMIFAGKKDILKNKYFYFMIFLIPGIFVFLQWNDKLIVDAIKQSFGWTFIWADNIWPYLFYFYYLSFVIAGGYVIYRCSIKTDNISKKIQAKIILSSAVISLGLGSITDVILLKFGIYKIPPLGDVAISFWALGIAYSITRYEFLITPVTAANNIISTMNDSLILIDTNGKIIDVNRAASALLDCRKEELKGKEIKLFFKDERFNERVIKSVINDIPIINQTTIMKAKNKGYINVVFSCSSLKDDLGSVVGAVCTASDITESERRKEELARAKEELELRAHELTRANEGIKKLLFDIEEKNRKLLQLNEMKTEFLSMVSHEIRTPLTIMKEFVLIVLDKIPGELNKEQEEYLTIVKNNINRLERIVNDLIDISRMETGKFKLSQTEVDISKIAEDAMNLFKTRADSKNIIIKYIEKNKIKHAYADPERLVQVFTNILSNALKFSPENSEITIEVKMEKTFIEVSITDYGPGIDKKYFDKIFERFQQIDVENGMKRPRGTGIGLSVTKKIIEQHGGRIWVESPVKENRGSRFIFTIPSVT